MPNTTVWERFFDAHAPIYDQNPATKACTAAGLDVEWIHADATRFSLPRHEIEIMVVARKTDEPAAGDA